MKKALHIVSLFSGALLLTLSSVSVAHYVNNHGEIIALDGNGKEIRRTVELAGEDGYLYPGDSKTLALSCTLPNPGKATCSVYFSDFDGELDVLTCKVSKDDYVSKDFALWRYTKSNPLTFDTVLDDGHKNFTFTFTVQDNGSEELVQECSFACHLKVENSKEGN